MNRNISTKVVRTAFSAISALLVAFTMVASKKIMGEEVDKDVNERLLIRDHFCAKVGPLYIEPCVDLEAHVSNEGDILRPILGMEDEVHDVFSPLVNCRWRRAFWL